MSAANVESHDIPLCNLTIPSIPLEIVGEILRHLDTVDLLNCRLVRKEWNNECLTTLKKRTTKPRVKLNKSNIQSFMKLVSSNSNLMSFPWKFEVDVRDGQSGYEFKIFAAQVMFVLSLYGPECVEKLILGSSFSGPGESEEIRCQLVFFSKLKAGLTQVHIVGEYFQGVPNSKTVRFPKLKSFKFGGSGGYYNDFEESLNAIDFFCHKNMESLEELKLPEDEEHSYDDLSLKKLSSLEIGNSYYASRLLAKIRRSPSPPIIRKISFGTRKDMDEIEELTEILAAVANTLKSLKLIDNGDFDEGDESAMISLPSLPHLQKFRIELRISFNPPEKSMSVDPSKYNFNAEALPTLEKVDLPTAYILDQPRQIFPFERENVRLPNVWRATLRISQDPGRILPTMDVNVDKLQEMFPNLRKITIVNETLEKSEVIKDLLLAIMASSQGSTLEELVIRNGDDDLNSVNFLGEILTKVNHPTRLILENVEQRTVTKEFTYAARNFIKSWAGLGEPGVKLTWAKGLEQNKVSVAVAVQNNPSSFDGIKNVKKIRLEQYSSIANEDRRWSRMKGVEGYAFPVPLNPTEQRQQLLKNRSQIDSIVKTFPALEQLEMSPYFFGQPKKYLCTLEIQELSSTYSNLKIRLI